MAERSEKHLILYLGSVEEPNVIIFINPTGQQGQPLDGGEQRTSQNYRVNQRSFPRRELQGKDGAVTGGTGKEGMYYSLVA